MIIYLKNGVSIKYENDPNIVVDLGGIDGYITVKKVMPDNKSFFSTTTIPKESLNFIDYENEKEAGVNKQVYIVNNQHVSKDENDGKQE